MGEVQDSQATCWPTVTTRATWLPSCFSGILKDRRQGGPGLRIKCNSAPDLSLHPRQQQLPLPEPGGWGCVYLYYPSAVQEGPANTSGRGIAGPEPQGRSPFGAVGGGVPEELGVGGRMARPGEQTFPNSVKSTRSPNSWVSQLTQPTEARNCQGGGMTLSCSRTRVVTEERWAELSGSPELPPLLF